MTMKKQSSFTKRDLLIHLARIGALGAGVGGVLTLLDEKNRIQTEKEIEAKRKKHVIPITVKKGACSSGLKIKPKVSTTEVKEYKSSYKTQGRGKDGKFSGTLKNAADTSVGNYMLAILGTPLAAYGGYAAIRHLYNKLVEKKLSSQVQKKQDEYVKKLLKSSEETSIAGGEQSGMAGSLYNLISVPYDAVKGVINSLPHTNLGLIPKADAALRALLVATPFVTGYLTYKSLEEINKDKQEKVKMPKFKTKYVIKKADKALILSEMYKQGYPIELDEYEKEFALTPYELQIDAVNKKAEVIDTIADKFDKDAALSQMVKTGWLNSIAPILIAARINDSLEDREKEAKKKAIKDENHNPLEEIEVELPDGKVITPKVKE